MNRKDAKTRRRRHHSNSAVTGCAMRKDTYHCSRTRLLGMATSKTNREKKRISQLHTVTQSSTQHAHTSNVRGYCSNNRSAMFVTIAPPSKDSVPESVRI